MVAVYASHLVGILFGLWIKDSRLRGNDSLLRWLKIVGSSLGASIIFFLVTNFAFLYSGYEHNLSGIILAYTNGLPFFRGTLLGDLGYTAALFGAYQAVQFIIRAKPRTLKSLT